MDSVDQVAFLRNDAAGMAQQVAASVNKPGAEDVLLALEADTAAYSGRLKNAREFSLRAVTSSERLEQKESAATYLVVSGMRETLFGNEGEARSDMAKISSTARDAEYGVALSLAYTGENSRAQVLTDDLAKRFREDTIVQFNFLPVLRAEFALRKGNVPEAIDALRAAVPYELGSSTSSSLCWTALIPIYVRGETYLAAHKGSEAAAEYQKILDHPGITMNEPVGALAHLGSARAYALEGESTSGTEAQNCKSKARAAYQDFLTLWKDADPDPDIPILKEAKAEYAKLR